MREGRLERETKTNLEEEAAISMELQMGEAIIMVTVESQMALACRAATHSVTTTIC